MDGHRISDVAERTGFSPATLRYYEDVGLVPPPARTEAGYRVYDDRSLDRLAFVARAKQLGLSLEDIGDLTRLWDQDECGNVQDRLADLVARRLSATEAQITELGHVVNRLRAAAGRLDAPAQPGPCDAACACNRAAPVDAPAPLVACTLDPSEVPDRVAAWRSMLARASERERFDGGVRVLFTPQPGVAAKLAALAEAEQACCAFFAFRIGIGADVISLEVQAPDDTGILDTLCG